MARYKSWKPTSKDLAELNQLRFFAFTERHAAFVSLTEDVGLDAEVAHELLPVIGEMNLETVDDLKAEFVNRADFNREKSRMRRIVNAAAGKPRKNVVSITPDNANQLTSFYIDEEGNVLESQYMRKERNFLISQENRRRMERLKRRGIEFEKVNLVDENLRNIYDENRHAMKIWMPRTPGMWDEYREQIQAHPELAIVDDAPILSNVIMWGDVIPASTKEKPIVYTPEQMADSSYVDYKRLESANRYFDNYKLLIDTTLPKMISDEIDTYISDMQYLGPDVVFDVYDKISMDEDVAGTIEYLYWDTAGSLPSKVARIINYWRTEIRPMIGLNQKQALEPAMVSRELEDMGYTANGLYPIFAEFQRRRPDEPKGKWRKDIRNA